MATEVEPVAAPAANKRPSTRNVARDYATHYHTRHFPGLSDRMKERLEVNGVATQRFLAEKHPEEQKLENVLMAMMQPQFLDEGEIAEQEKKNRKDRGRQEQHEAREPKSHHHRQRESIDKHRRKSAHKHRSRSHRRTGRKERGEGKAEEVELPLERDEGAKPSMEKGEEAQLPMKMETVDKEQHQARERKSLHHRPRESIDKRRRKSSNRHRSRSHGRTGRKKQGEDNAEEVQLPLESCEEAQPSMEKDEEAPPPMKMEIVDREPQVLILPEPSDAEVSNQDVAGLKQMQGESPLLVQLLRAALTAYEKLSDDQRRTFHWVFMSVTSLWILRVILNQQM